MSQHYQSAEERFEVGDLVEKIGGDYTFVGNVRSVFTKNSGAVRYVVEDDRGVLHVYSRKNLRRSQPSSVTAETTKHFHKEVSIVIVHPSKATPEAAGFYFSVGEADRDKFRSIAGPYETEQAALNAAVWQIERIAKALDAEVAKFGLVSEDDMRNTLQSSLTECLGVLGTELKNGDQETSN